MLTSNLKIMHQLGVGQSGETGLDHVAPSNAKCLAALVLVVRSGWSVVVFALERRQVTPSANLILIFALDGFAAASTTEDRRTDADALGQ